MALPLWAVELRVLLTFRLFVLLISVLLVSELSVVEELPPEDELLLGPAADELTLLAGAGGGGQAITVAPDGGWLTF